MTSMRRRFVETEIQAIRDEPSSAVTLPVRNPATARGS
jgi:hypothetical protein